MADPRDLAQLRRLRAELELTRAIHAVTIHELGNPLQSLLVSVELSRDELRVAEREGGAVERRAVDRLDRALESVARLRSVLLRATAIRAELQAKPGERERDEPWGRFLDEIGGFMAERLAQVRAQLIRSTAEIDPRPIVGDALRPATFALLLGVTQQLREARGRDWTVTLTGRVLRDQTCVRVGVRGPAGPIAIADAVAQQVDDLLATDPDAHLLRDGDDLVMWCPRA